MPEPLMGVTEIAELLGVSRQRAGQLAATFGFPAPLARLAVGPIWRREDIEQWARDAGRIE